VTLESAMIVEFSGLVLGLVFSRIRPSDLPDHVRDGSGRVRCPLCGWEPGKRARWSCDPRCGHLWNTFETRGVCPRCEKRWLETACLRCHGWSRHEAWYESSGPEDPR
jgi:hypothetical protein